MRGAACVYPVDTKQKKTPKVDTRKDLRKRRKREREALKKPLFLSFEVLRDWSSLRETEEGKVSSLARRKERRE